MKTSRKVSQVALGLSLLGLCLSSSSTTQAGDYAFEVRFSNMTPDEFSDDASKKCAAAFRGSLLTGGANAVSMGETPLRKAVNAEDKSVSFMSWTLEQVSPSLGGQTWGSPVSLVAVDCRPADKSLDVLIINSLTKSKIAVRLRGQEINKRRLDWFVEEALTNAWAGHR
jgi:hypothetical protein